MSVASKPDGPASAATFRKPLVSICVTTYNRAAWLEHTLPLVLGQTRPYPDLVEVVVCDNASTDHTPAVVDRLRGSPNLRAHRNEYNVGMLGNLAVSAAQARGRFVWVIGDDDLLVEGAVERVLSAIALHPDVELLYLNYAYTRFDRPQDLTSVDEVIQGAVRTSTAARDEYTPRIRTISTKSDNCFTAIYCLVFREDRARAAYGQDTSGPPFSTLATCVPTTQYVVEQMFDRPGYWMADPCVVVNMNVSWMRYAAPFILERFPEVFDRMEARGADRAEVDALRSRHVPQLLHWVSEVYLGQQGEHRGSFSMERLVRRFGHLEAFRRQWPAMRAVYARARGTGSVEGGALAPEQLDALVASAGRGGRR